MIIEIILKYYGTHTSFDLVTTYLDGFNVNEPVIVNLEGERKSFESVLCFKDEGFWEEKFNDPKIINYEILTPINLEKIINILKQDTYRSVAHVDKVFPGKTKIPYVYYGENENDLIKKGKINLSNCVDGDLYLNGEVKDIYFDEDEKKRGLEVINYTKKISNWRHFVKRDEVYCEHYGTDFESLKKPEVTIKYTNNKTETYKNINEVLNVLNYHKKINYKVFPFKNSNMKKLETLIFNFITSSITQVKFINEVHSITNIEKNVLQDLFVSITLFENKNQISKEEFLSMHPYIYSEIDCWLMLLRWLKRFKMGEVSKLEFGNSTSWMLIKKGCSQDLLSKIKIVNNDI